MKRLLASFLLLLLVAAAPPFATGRLQVCPGGPVSCGDADLARLPLKGPETLLARTVTVRPDALPLDRPLMVWVIAMASSEVRWNGIVIGRNGIPGRNRAEEVPGRFVATFTVPNDLVRPGANIVTARMSAHRLWLPVRRPVHVVDVGLYESHGLTGDDDYLPALLMLGALLAACLYFGAAAASDRRDRGALLLSLIAATALLQLLVEVSRAFIAYTYPWHLARVSAIAGLAALTSLFAAGYGARRFAPEWRRGAVLATAAAALASLLLIPWFDLKAFGAFLAAAMAIAACSIRALRRGRRFDAWIALAAALAVPVLMATMFTDFLDQGYYILLAALLIALIVEQANYLRRARAERDREALRAAGLAERLARAEREGEPILTLKDGTRSHRVAESDIVSIRAADDYCDVALAGGRTLLVTMSLARLLETLPPRFERVHKSHAVNRTHVTTIQPRPGGGRLLELSDGSTVPVGRSYAAAVVEWMC